MAKKTAQREQRAEETTESDGNQETSAETGAVAPEASAAAPDYASESSATASLQASDLSLVAGGADPLMKEVQSFLGQRAALAKKLAEEIAALEAKLAELKKTAALLFPEQQAKEPAKDRRARKPRPRPSRSGGEAPAEAAS